jgi:hypothetical protein
MRGCLYEWPVEPKGFPDRAAEPFGPLAPLILISRF